MLKVPARKMPEFVFDPPPGISGGPTVRPFDPRAERYGPPSPNVEDRRRQLPNRGPKEPRGGYSADPATRTDQDIDKAVDEFTEAYNEETAFKEAQRKYYEDLIARIDKTLQETRSIPTRAEWFMKGTVDPTQYDTPLTPDEERSFQSWKQKYAPRDSGEDYDLRGAFKVGLKPDPKSGHWPDTYKKPNHPTFSNESKYAKDRPDLAGHWEGEKFIPPGARQ